MTEKITLPEGSVPGPADERPDTGGVPDRARARVLFERLHQLPEGDPERPHSPSSPHSGDGTEPDGGTEPT